MKQKLQNLLIQALCPSKIIAQEVESKAKSTQATLCGLLFLIFEASENELRSKQTRVPANAGDVTMLEMVEELRERPENRESVRRATELLELKCLTQAYGDFNVQELGQALDELGQCAYLSGSFPQRVTQIHGLVEEFIGE